MILSLLTFGVAFVARPLGSLLFGHFGDKLGRKRALVVSLLMMGLSTVAIGFLPGFKAIGMASIVLLCLARFIQGIGLGGEWSGAVLVATENAPKGKRALFGSFTELGAPIGSSLVMGCTISWNQHLANHKWLIWMADSVPGFSYSGCRWSLGSPQNAGDPIVPLGSTT